MKHIGHYQVFPNGGIPQTDGKQRRCSSTRKIGRIAALIKRTIGSQHNGTQALIAMHIVHIIEKSTNIGSLIGKRKIGSLPDGRSESVTQDLKISRKRSLEGFPIRSKSLEGIGRGTCGYRSRSILPQHNNRFFGSRLQSPQQRFHQQDGQGCRDYPSQQGHGSDHPGRLIAKRLVPEIQGSCQAGADQQTNQEVPGRIFKNKTFHVYGVGVCTNGIRIKRKQILQKIPNKLLVFC